MNTRALTLSVWLACLLLAGAYISTRLQVATDLTLFLPRGANAEQQLLLDQLREGQGSRMLFVSLSGAPPAALARLNKKLAAALRKHPSIVNVTNGEPATQAERIEAIAPYRYLLSPRLDLDEPFSTHALRAALQQRLAELSGSEAHLYKPWLTRDPSGELAALAASWSGGARPARKHGVWFGVDGAQSLLLIESGLPGYELDAQERLLADIRNGFDAARAATPKASDAGILLSGAPVFAVESRRITRDETRELSLFATLAMICLMLFAYRSAKPILLGALPLLSGLILATALTGLLNGGIHGITLAFGVTLLGVAIDYPIHALSHSRPGRPLLVALPLIWPTLRLGVLTSCVAYLAMTTTDFSGLIQLGQFTVIGLLSAVAVTRWVLPALNPGFAVAPSRHVHDSRIAGLRNEFAGKFAGPAAVALALVLLAASGLFATPLWESNLNALSPVPANMVRADRQLRTQLGGTDMRHVLVFQAADAESALRGAEKLGKRLNALIDQGVLAGYQSPARWLPSQSRQAERREKIPAVGELEQRLRSALAGLPFKAGAFQPFLAEIEQARAQTFLDWETAGGLPIAGAVQRGLSRGPGGWRALLQPSGVKDGSALRAAFAGEPGVIYLDLKQATESMIASFRQDMLQRLGFGALALLALLWLGLKTPRRVLAVAAPLALAMALDIFILRALGVSLSLFHLIALLLVAGIGLDYALFFSREAEAAERAHTLHAILVCAGSTGAVFGMLALSDIPVLKAIGQTVVIGVVAAFLCSWLFARVPAADTGGGNPDNNE